MVDDPYRFLPTLGEIDMHLIAEGRHETLWTALGAHVRHYSSVLGAIDGVSFAVWAPGARAVRVKADFNGWDGSIHAMRGAGQLRRLGDLCPRRAGQRRLQVRGPRQ
jgi:1,4-alpha-glucan branching enzyme